MPTDLDAVTSGLSSIKHRASGIPVVVTVLCAAFLAFDGGLVILLYCRSLLGFWLVPITAVAVIVLGALEHDAQQREERHVVRA